MIASSTLHPAAVHADQPSHHLTSPARCTGLLRLRLSRVRISRQALGRALRRVAYPLNLAGIR